ncbi:MAG: hypothetical protein JWQ87_101 [Candidatus Sulfotelmatobacter sp.]|nr:hypothetical protein [Candidatus Sulfotelmatobacter sp.]
MYAIDPVQKASRKYMVTSVQILSRTPDGRVGVRSQVIEPPWRRFKASN